MHLDNFNYTVLGLNTQQGAQQSTQKRVVFLHGLMAFSANWRKIANSIANSNANDSANNSGGQVADGYQCLIYDQRGHGRSFKPDAGYSLEILAEDLNKITSELDWQSFHLVGHSMGANVAVIFAYKFSEKVKSLTIEDMGASILSESYKYYEKMLSLVPTPFASKVEVKYFFDYEFLKLFSYELLKQAENPKVLASFLQANIEEKENATYDWRFSKQAVVEIAKNSGENDRWLEISSLKMPVLLLRGENSTVLSAEEFQKMLQINPQIIGVEIKGAGHWLHYEKHEEFTQVLLEFIQRH